jgi:cell fate regulator YaaT (PSP1 superfamily)
VLRRASQEEIRIANDLRRAEEDIRRQSTEKVRQHKLEMKVSDAEWQWDRSKLTLFFTAEKRVDFRALVRDLASAFRTRIELRQIGVRDEAARLGGVGRCGREYCCSTWLTELSPVSLALAKDQHLSLNPAQISGGCGRLLCCLKYEHEFYVAARKRFPREGKTILTARGLEKVIAVDIFRERVFIRHEDGSRIVPLVQLREEMDQAQASGATEAVGPPARSAPADRPSREERPAGRPESRRPGEGRGTARASDAPPPAPPGPPAPERPTGEERRPRRRRRGRRGGRGPQGGPPGPPTPPEA